MRKDFIFGLSTVGLLLVLVIIYLVIRKNNSDHYQAAIGALRPSHPGEYEDIGGVPRGLGWV